ncbi:hypothetical protein I79_011975 [Cricetulus griseus]|uniref:Uncharacterized protein n=1 Tax=Cricetulus griseus TaxID=10029 RepID=G3HML0_CRIGR|nr:hypothetical protein I79_011975 [Cricetulus griseus]
MPTNHIVRTVTVTALLLGTNLFISYFSHCCNQIPDKKHLFWFMMMGVVGRQCFHANV